MHIEWLRFLRKIEHETLKDKELHLICYNYATHKHPKVLDWMSRHKRIHVHSPTSASWLNMVERFFRDISDQRLCRGVFTSVQNSRPPSINISFTTTKIPSRLSGQQKSLTSRKKVIRANNRLSSKQNATQH